MISKEKHKKHGKLVRPQLGRFGRMEFCLVGTRCIEIKEFVDGFIQFCPENIKVAYVDASHKEGDQAIDNLNATFKSGTAQVEGSFDNEWHIRHRLLDANIVFVNGNHFEAGNQIVFVDPAKIKSLERRMQWIKDPQFFIFREKECQLFPFLETDENKNLPAFQLEEKEKIFQYILKLVQKRFPPLKALVLGGGESLRMGKDKSQLNYHDLPQEVFLAKLLNKTGLDVYISKRKSESSEIDGFPVLLDRVTDLGPFGAILTAFMQDPDSAWLVVACDLPFIQPEDIERLMNERDPYKMATCYRSTQKEFPEPLITIWEPSSYHILLKFLAQGISCPRKVLINSDKKEIVTDNAHFLANINTPAELMEAQKLLDQQKLKGAH